MPYLKLDIFIELKRRKIADFTINSNRKADVKCAEKIFCRNDLRGIEILRDGAYDCGWLHELVREKKRKLYAPVRKSPHKNPRGLYRKLCVKLPEFIWQ